jgi:hypothetical protein
MKKVSRANTDNHHGAFRYIQGLAEQFYASSPNGEQATPEDIV